MSRRSPDSRPGSLRLPRIVIAMLASMVSMVAVAHDEARRPQLVVGIVIDGLDQQYIDLLRSHFGDDGFNRLLRDGVFVPNADYGTALDATAATAMLMTGAAPATNGVPAAMVFDRDALRPVEVMKDGDEMGNFTTQGYSPRRLLASTIADEARIAGGGVTHVYSVAPDAAQAVILAGHSANCAIWLNDRTGNWATSTFYKDAPTTLTRRNRTMPLSARLDTMQWTPLRGAEYYPGLPEHLTHYPFRYTFGRGNDGRYAMFASSPLVNREVTDIAGDIINDMKLGSSDGVDMVNIAYSLRPYDYTKNDDNRYELIDAYLRLDRDIARIIKTVEGRVEPDRAVFFLAATPPTGRVRRDDERWAIPYGEFSTKKARSLLNMYLIAKYGNGEWIKTFYANQFYLNHQLISDKSLDPEKVRLDAATFLARMSGVDRVYTVDEILAGRGDERIRALRRNMHPESMGDLLIEVDPGWEVLDDAISTAAPDRVKYVQRYAAPVAPFIIMAPGVAPRVIETPVDARMLAPTVTRRLRIRSPNAAAMPGLVL